jgi:hypothetical protein
MTRTASTTSAASKRYDDICAEWLGGLAVHKFKSVIERDQLGPHLHQLVDANFLSSYNLEPAKTRNGFVITFKPGRAFFEDYDQFYRKQQHGAVRSNFTADSQKIKEPLQVAYLFAEKRFGRPASLIGFVNSKDVETAKLLLTKIDFGDMSAFLDYALAEARSTRFDVQTLGGLKQYVTAYLATRERWETARAEDISRRTTEREDALRSEYDAYRRSEASRIFAGLPKAAKAKIEIDARPHVTSFTGPLREQMLELRKRMLTSQRYDDRIKSFEQWKATYRPN